MRVLLVLIGLIVVSSTSAETSDISKYPLSICLVSGERIGSHGTPVILTTNGREIRLCCESCLPDFERDESAFLAALDSAIVARQGAGYPLATCMVSGKRLGSMGDPMNAIVGNRLVKLCCSSCEPELAQNPTAAVVALDAAVIAVQTAHYPADACPISGEALGSMGTPFDYVFAGKLVRFCCNGCLDSFNANPVAALERVYQTLPSGSPAESR